MPSVKFYATFPKTKINHGRNKLNYHQYFYLPGFKYLLGISLMIKKSMIYEGHSINKLNSRTFFKDISNNGFFHISEDRQHDLL